MMRNRLRLGLILGLAAALGLAAPAGATVNITFWNLFTGGDGATMTAMVNEFNAAQSDVHVEATTLPWGNPYYSKLLTATIAGSPPDVAVMHVSRLRPYALQGVMMPLTQTDLDAMGLRSTDFFPNLWQGGQLNGVQYAVPIDFHPYALYYNTRLFAEAGLPDTGPANGDELVLDAQKLTKKDDAGKISVWGYCCEGPREWFGAMLQYGGHILNADKSDVDFVTNSAGQDAIAYYLRLKDAVGGAYGGDFARQTQAMLQVGPWQVGTYERQGVPFLTKPMPQIGPVQNATWTDSHTLFIPAPIAKGDPAKLKAAETFIGWISDHTYEWSKGAGHVPARQDIAESTQYRLLTHELGFSASITIAHYYPRIGDSTQLEDTIWKYAGPALSRKVDPGEAVRNMATGILDIVKADREKYKTEE